MFLHLPTHLLLKVSEEALEVAVCAPSGFFSYESLQEWTVGKTTSFRKSN